jgi:hypothetical protein
MDPQMIAYISMLASLLVFAVVGIASRSRVTSKRLLIAVAAIVAFFAAWTAIILVEKQTIGVLPLVLFAWFSAFVFYLFGTRYLTGRGLFARPYHDERVAPHGEDSPVLRSVLRATRHILLWPMVILVIFVLARGFMGHGWVLSM